MVHTALSSAACKAISTNGTSLIRDGRPLFLNGVNLAWVDWGTDFVAEPATAGAPAYCGWEEALRFVAGNGGNAVRVWLFTDPARQLTWHDTGRVAGTAPGVFTMVQTLLALAAHYGVVVVLTLFNGALAQSAEACSLFSDDAVLASLLESVVTPLAHAVRGYHSLGLIDVINEPEGLVDVWASSIEAGAEQVCGAVDGVSDCAGTRDGPGWNEQCRFPLHRMQRFINRVAGAIKGVDESLLLTVGSWHACAASVDAANAGAAPSGARHLFSDACLLGAGGDVRGRVDVRQVHAYPKEPSAAGRPGALFDIHSAVGRSAASLHVRTPVFIGEVSSRWDESHSTAASPTSAVTYSMARLHVDALHAGYAGILYA